MSSSWHGMGRLVDGLSTQLCSLESEVVDSDNYPLTNLKCGAGPFMAERFVKPPVILKFNFPPKTITRILGLDVGLKVGGHKTTGVEIFLTEVMNEVPVSVKIGVGYLSREELNDVHVLRFSDRRFTQRICNEKGEENSTKHLTFFKTEKLNTTTQLIFRITRSQFIPCLGFVRIWVLVPPQIWRTIQPQETQCEAKETTSISGKEQESSTLVVETTERDKEVEIPVEFLDSLTFQIMSLPVLLPSGHTIDRTSLEKYNMEQAKHGRLSNDPFTGMGFDDTSQLPLPNVALKRRMDQFWNLHPHLSRKNNIGRTLCAESFAVLPLSPPEVQLPIYRKRKRVVSNEPNSVAVKNSKLETPKRNLNFDSDFEQKIVSVPLKTNLARTQHSHSRVCADVSKSDDSQSSVEDACAVKDVVSSETDTTLSSVVVDALKNKPSFI